MEVVEACSRTLSNREVLEILRNYKGNKHTNLATILYETTSYLEQSPAATSRLSDIAEFLQKLRDRGYDLTKHEKIQIANLKPQNEIELQLIVDNIEERFTEEMRADILELIQQLLEKGPDQVQATNKRLKS